MMSLAIMELAKRNKALCTPDYAKFCHTHYQILILEYSSILFVLLKVIRDIFLNSRPPFLQEKGEIPPTLSDHCNMPTLDDNFTTELITHSY